MVNNIYPNTPECPWGAVYQVWIDVKDDAPDNGETVIVSDGVKIQEAIYMNGSFHGHSLPKVVQWRRE